MGEVASIEVAEMRREERLEFPDARLARNLAKPAVELATPGPLCWAFKGADVTKIPCNWQPGSGMDREGGVLNGPTGAVPLVH